MMVVTLVAAFSFFFLMDFLWLLDDSWILKIVGVLLFIFVWCPALIFVLKIAAARAESEYRRISGSSAKRERNKMTPKLRKEILERDGYTCNYCGRYLPDGNGAHIDHIIPVSKGGLTERSNLQVLCARCNLKKSNKLY